LLERGADINGAPPGRGVNPLLRASHLSDDEIIRLLVMHGAPLNIVQEGTPGFTPLQELVRWAAPDTITLLLDRGAEVNMRSLGKEWTALHVAAVSDRPEIVQLLLLRGGCDSWVR
jgi:ankyrin repeat protein